MTTIIHQVNLHLFISNQFAHLILILLFISRNNENVALYYSFKLCILAYTRQTFLRHNVWLRVVHMYLEWPVVMAT